MGNGSISDAHTGVIPASSPPKGKPPEPSNRLPRVRLFFCSILDLLIFEGLSVTDYGHIFVCADLLDVSVHDDVAELLIEFRRITHAPGLFAGDKRTAAAAEGVKHQSVGLRGVADGVSKQRNGLHRGMVAVLLGLV